MTPPEIEVYLNEFLRVHACHTVILYGSFARGDFTPSSDIDMAGFSDSIENLKRDARFFNGRYLDFFILPQKVYLHPNLGHLHMRTAKILRDPLGHAKRFKDTLETLYCKGPTPLPLDEKLARKVWYQKMLDRTQAGDIEGRFRSLQLKTSLLEDYFSLRDLWYEGSKIAFQWLAKNDPEVFNAFDRAFDCDSPSQDPHAVRRLVRLVTERQTP